MDYKYTTTKKENGNRIWYVEGLIDNQIWNQILWKPEDLVTVYI